MGKENESIKVYSFLNKNLYDELKSKGKVIPRIGVTQNLRSIGAYLALERRFGMKFFGWDRVFWDNHNYSKNIYEVPENKSEVVLVTLDIPKSEVLFTNFRNWTDMDCIYYGLDREPTSEELQDILNDEFNGLERTIDELWSDVFVLDDIDPTQILMNYLDYKWITDIKYMSSRVISF